MSPARSSPRKRLAFTSQCPAGGPVEQFDEVAAMRGKKCEQLGVDD